MKRNLALLPKKREAFVAIRRFMCDGDITLKVDEEEILKRWMYCDALLRAKEDDEDAMVDKIVKQFNVSIFTARNDIGFTQRLFADARKVNKKYLIHHHLMRIDQDIQRIRKKLFETLPGNGGKTVECIPDSKEMIALAKLHEAYTYTLNSIPDDVQVDKQPPPIFQFILAPGQVIDRPMLIDDALKQADTILMKQNPIGVYETAEDEQEP